mmetsp:Transcript_78485/g.212328  ORF Transcript_78485/g.212328 Transcript_78485/m.212328 type:complete len:915 (+) Transcript_78485:3-2747(+)
MLSIAASAAGAALPSASPVGGASTGALLSPCGALPSSPRGQQTSGISNILRAHPVPAVDPIRWGAPARKSAGGVEATTVTPATKVASPRQILSNSASNNRPGSTTPPARQPDDRRKVGQPCHFDLYEDAFAKQERLKNLKEHVEQAHEREEHMRQLQREEEMKNRRRFYKTKDKRSHLEREQDAIRKKKENREAKEAEQRAREEQELRECTFKPSLVKKLNRDRDLGLSDNRAGGTSMTPSAPAATTCRAQSPLRLAAGTSQTMLSPRTGAGDMDYSAKLKDLVQKQKVSADGLKALSDEDAKLRERLREAHADLYDSILREETQRVVALLQEAHDEGGGGSSAQKELIRRVRSMVAQGGNLESAQKMIVDELVGQSQEEVQRRVLEAFLPMRFEAEGGLYTKRLAFVHELEAVEAQVMALKGGTLYEEAKAMGFEFGLADQARLSLSSARGAGQGTKTPSMVTLPHMGGQAGGHPILSSRVSLCNDPSGLDSPRSMVSAGTGTPAIHHSVGARPPATMTTAILPQAMSSGYASGRVTPRSQVLHSPRRVPSECGGFAGAPSVGAPAGAFFSGGATVPTVVLPAGTPLGQGSFTPRGSAVPGSEASGATPGGSNIAVMGSDLASSPGARTGAETGTSAATANPSPGFGSPADADASEWRGVAEEQEQDRDVPTASTAALGSVSPVRAVGSPVSLAATHGFTSAEEGTCGTERAAAAFSALVDGVETAANEGDAGNVASSPAGSPASKILMAKVVEAAKHAAMDAAMATSPRMDLKQIPQHATVPLPIMTAAPPLSARGPSSNTMLPAAPVVVGHQQFLQQQQRVGQMQVLTPRGVPAPYPVPGVGTPGSMIRQFPQVAATAQMGTTFTASTSPVLAPMQMQGRHVSAPGFGGALQMATPGQPAMFSAPATAWGM